MKLLSIIFLLLAVILSVIACVLPHWSKNEIILDVNIDDNILIKADMSRHDGLWIKCEKYTGSNTIGVPMPQKNDLRNTPWETGCKTFGSPETPEPEGNLVSKILSIVGPSLLLISAVFFDVGTKHSKIIGVFGVWSLLAVVLVYPLLVLNHNIKNEQTICHQPTNDGMKEHMNVTCNTGTVSISYFLEIGAIIMAIIGLMIHMGKSRKTHSRRGRDY